MTNNSSNCVFYPNPQRKLEMDRKSKGENDGMDISGIEYAWYVSGTAETKMFKEDWSQNIQRQK